MSRCNLDARGDPVTSWVLKTCYYHTGKTLKGFSTKCLLKTSARATVEPHVAWKKWDFFYQSQTYDLSWPAQVAIYFNCVQTVNMWLRRRVSHLRSNTSNFSKWHDTCALHSRRTRTAILSHSKRPDGGRSKNQSFGIVFYSFNRFPWPYTWYSLKQKALRTWACRFSDFRKYVRGRIIRVSGGSLWKFWNENFRYLCARKDVLSK